MRHLFLLLATVTTLTASAQQTITVSGKIGSLKKGDKVFLSQVVTGKAVDSMVVTGKSFSLTLPMEKPGLYNLSTAGSSPGGTLLYLQPGKVKVSGKTIREARYKGDPYMKEFTQFTKSIANQPLLKKYEALSKEYRKAVEKKDTALRSSLMREARTMGPQADSVRTAVATNWLNEHPQSDINAYVLYMYLRRKKTLEELEQALNGLSAAAKNSGLAETMYHSIEVAKVTAVGKMAPDFTQNDPDGKPVSLSSLRGKYVLVDFWASWCGPCRAENPNVVAAYKKFANRNFTVLGVSLDNNKNKWVEAIAKDELDWQHVSDLQFWNNAVAKQYDINAIPANLLVDPSGKIVAKNLRGEKLHQTLGEMIQ